MAAINRVIVIGNITNTIRFGTTGTGKPVCGFTLAINSKHKMSNGQLKDKVVYIDVTVWKTNLVESCRNIGKGDQILVEGRLDNSQWTGKDGDKREKVEIIASNIQFIEIKTKNSA